MDTSKPLKSLKKQLLGCKRSTWSKMLTAKVASCHRKCMKMRTIQPRFVFDPFIFPPWTQSLIERSWCHRSLSDEQERSFQLWPVPLPQFFLLLRRACLQGKFSAPKPRLMQQLQRSVEPLDVDCSCSPNQGLPIRITMKPDNSSWSQYQHVDSISPYFAFTRKLAIRCSRRQCCNSGGYAWYNPNRWMLGPVQSSVSTVWT